MKLSNSTINGQLSMFDIRTIEKPKKIEVNTEILERIELTKKNEIFNNNFEITEMQQTTIDHFKATQNIYRILLYAKGSIGIESHQDSAFVTYYIDRKGNTELSFNAKSPVLPWDKIIYYNSQLEKVPLTKIQLEKLQKLLNKERDLIKRVIHRKADENLLIEYDEKIISILASGWQLEFESINYIDCDKDEVFLIPTKTDIVKDKSNEPSQEQPKAKIGDYVQARHGKRVIEGEIVREYGLGNEILNIQFDNDTKHTAIGRSAVIKIIRCSEERSVI